MNILAEDDQVVAVLVDATSLVEQANDRGGEDNITVVLLKFEE